MKLEKREVNTKSPLVSIVLPVYNAAHYIDIAIKSVLAQSLQDWELLIIDDGSTDNLKNILSNFSDDRIIYLANDNNKGYVKTRNIGLQIARGEYLACIDADDEWCDTHKLKIQTDFLTTNPSYVLVGTNAFFVNEERIIIGEVSFPLTDTAIRRKILRINCFLHSSVLYKKEKAINIGGYTEILEDYDLWLRLGLQGKFANLPNFCVKYMIRSDGANSSKKFIRLKQNIILAKKYRKKYPGYIKAKIFGILKFCFYSIYRLLPLSFQMKLLKLHKKL